MIGETLHRRDLVEHVMAAIEDDLWRQVNAAMDDITRLPSVTRPRKVSIHVILVPSPNSSAVLHVKVDQAYPDRKGTVLTGRMETVEELNGTSQKMVLRRERFVAPADETAEEPAAARTDGMIVHDPAPASLLRAMGFNEEEILTFVAPGVFTRVELQDLCREARRRHEAIQTPITLYQVANDLISSRLSQKREEPTPFNECGTSEHKARWIGQGQIFTILSRIGMNECRIEEVMEIPDISVMRVNDAVSIARQVAYGGDERPLPDLVYELLTGVVVAARAAVPTGQ